MATLSSLLLLLFLCDYGSAGDGPVVQTKYGKVKGKYIDQLQVFKSIPFAGPVSGSNRWKDPQPPAAWLGTLDGTVDPPACPQDCSPVGCPLPKPEVMDEDCLFLNVYAPRNVNTESNLPVLVFIHGGSFIRGSSTVPWYDGSYLAVHSNIVVVTVNYRLGVLGFLVHNSDSEAITGNFGIKDQLLALQWVQDNIHQFGGDPTQVTLSGESAGAMCVAIHMTNMKTSGLFHKAIIQSDPFGIEYKLVTAQRKNGEEFAKALGCTTPGDLECLRSKDVKQILDASNQTWAPTVNGAEVADQPLALIQSGHFRAEVPAIMGTTAAEGAFFVYFVLKEKLPTSWYRTALTIIFGADNVEEALKIYPAPSEGEDIRPQIAEIITDTTFYCPTVSSAKSVRHHSPGTPVYFYIFNHSLPQPNVANIKHRVSIPECYTEACHVAELPFVFHTDDILEYTPEELHLADSISQYWGNFVKYGDPNGQLAEQVEGYCTEEECKGEVEWPQFSNSTNWNTLIFDTPENKVESTFRQNVCEVLDTFSYESSVYVALFRIASTVKDADPKKEV